MYRFSSTPRLLRSFTLNPCSQLSRGLATLASEYTLSVLEAPSPSYAQHHDHVDRVSSQLERTGMLKISLGFRDDSSSYLKQLLISLHENHNHNLPISHSSRQGWFWDVRPSKTMFQAGDHQVRSCIYELTSHSDKYRHDQKQCPNFRGTPIARMKIPYHGTLPSKSFSMIVTEEALYPS